MIDMTIEGDNTKMAADTEKMFDEGGVAVAVAPTEEPAVIAEEAKEFAAAAESAVAAEKAPKKQTATASLKEEEETVAYDVELDSENKIEFEVETEPADPANAPAGDEEDYSGDLYEGYAEDGTVVARRINKHVFTWVFSFILGIYGVDRFIRGQTFLGVLKLATFGGLGMWYMVDLIIAITKSYVGEYRDLDDIMFDIYGRYIY